MKRDQRGALNVLLIPFILVLLILIGTAYYTYTLFQSEQKYKNHSDQLVSAAVTTAKQQQSQLDEAQFAEQAKQPLVAYTGPSAYGSIVAYYPKTWSAYVDEEDNSSTPINGYFEPAVVPSISNDENTFALRLQVTSDTYSDVVDQFSSLQQEGEVTVTPFSFAKVPSVIGVRIDGQIEPNVQGSMVIVPLRNTTLQLWTESSQFEADFNNNVLPNFSFSP